MSTHFIFKWITENAISKCAGNTPRDLINPTVSRTRFRGVLLGIGMFVVSMEIGAGCGVRSAFYSGNLRGTLGTTEYDRVGSDVIGLRLLVVTDIAAVHVMLSLCFVLCSPFSHTFISSALEGYSIPNL